MKKEVGFLDHTVQDGLDSIPQKLKTLSTIQIKVLDGKMESHIVLKLIYTIKIKLLFDQLSLHVMKNTTEKDWRR